MSTVIRPTRTADGPRVWQLLRQFATSYPADEAAFSGSFAGLLVDGKAVFLVVEEEYAVVG